MSETTLKEMSLEELDVRGAELRADLCSLHEGERSDENSRRMRELMSEVDVFDRVFTLARHQAAREAERAAREAANQLPPAGATAGHSGTRQPAFAELLVEGMREFVERGWKSTKDEPHLTLEIGGFIDPSTRNLFNGERAATWSEFGAGGPGNAASGATNTLLPVGQPIAPIPRQARLAMRDLIPSQPTTLSQVPYVRELNPTTGESGATSVAEGNVKPDGSLSFSGQNAPITVIAVSLSPTKQLWQDAPLVVAYVNQRLPYLTRFREDAEIIGGSGTWPDITGLKNTAGVQSQAATAGEFAITIGSAIAKVENVDGTATGVVLNPTDAWSMFTKRAAGGSGTFDAGTPFSDIPMTVWGLPTVRSRAYASGSCLVGDYAHGAMILDREGVNVQIFPQHSDYAARNQVLILCEERVGLACWRPDLFVATTLA